MSLRSNHCDLITPRGCTRVHNKSGHAVRPGLDECRMRWKTQQYSQLWKRRNCHLVTWYLVPTPMFHHDPSILTSIFNCHCDITAVHPAISSSPFFTSGWITLFRDDLWRYISFALAGESLLTPGGPPAVSALLDPLINLRPSPSTLFCCGDAACQHRSPEPPVRQPNRPQHDQHCSAHLLQGRGLQVVLARRGRRLQWDRHSPRDHGEARHGALGDPVHALSLHRCVLKR